MGWFTTAIMGVSMSRLCITIGSLMRITASTGSVEDSYDNALVENVNGSYKNELINNHRWKDVLEVEIATFEWVNWWNQARLHQVLDYRTPVEVEVENEYRHTSDVSEKIKTRANA